jgi:hypothetical protein
MRKLFAAALLATSITLVPSTAFADEVFASSDDGDCTTSVVVTDVVRTTIESGGSIVVIEDISFVVEEVCVSDALPIPEGSDT